MSDMVNRSHHDAGAEAHVSRTADDHQGMLLARVVWWSCASAVGATGTLACLAFVPAGVAVLTAFLVGSFGFGVASLLPASLAASPRQARVRGVVFGILAGLTTTGLVELAGPEALALTMLLLATSPVVRRLWSQSPAARSVRPAARARTPRASDRIRRSPACPWAAAQVAPPEPPCVQTMTDAQLCWAWRASFVALQRCSDHGTVYLAASRAAYLDELERRDPAGFARWIQEGARAASDPWRYLRATDASRDPAYEQAPPAPLPESTDPPERETS